MAQRHLKELLEEDQEPFYLKDYIADKKCIILKKQSPKTTQIQVKKHKNNSFFPKNVCFSSMQQYSPDYRKSPLFDFSKSPVSKKSPNRVLLHVPAKTASLLLEAALKIQQKSKPKSHFRQSGFGLFGSVLKRLSLRTRTQTQKLKQSDAETNAGVVVNGLSNVLSVSSGSSSSSNYNVRTSSLDLESSSSSSSSSSGRSFGDNHNHDDDDNDDYDDDDDDDDDYDEEFEFSNVLLADNNDDNNHGDYGALCSSPFHFANSSPNIFQNNQNYDEQDSSVKCQLEEDDEEDKEQNSPVSVFDPPFEDDYDNHDDDCYDDYAFVQRAKQQLMHKLHRFEKLAKLDPIELEKKMLDDNDNSEEHGVVLQATDEMDEYDYESFTFANQEHSHDLLEDSVATSGFQDINKPGIKRLISDLIIEEQQNVENYELIISGLLKRMEEWKEVECNTIDMMVETDLRGENGDWKKPKTQISETASDIEVAIFGVLVTELVTEIAYSSADGRCGQ